jgi:hypothetical protein
MKGVSVVKVTSIGIICLLAALSVGAVQAAPSVLGGSGLILIPDDVVLAPGGVNLAYHGITDFGPGGDMGSFFSANFGILPKLEVGATVISDGGSDVLINAKFRVMSEAAQRPAISIGVVDAASQLTNDPSFYIVLSKSLTQTAEDMRGESSKPIRGHLGFGTGVFRTIFAGLDFTLAPKLSLMVEGISDSDFGGGQINAGIRYAVTNNVRLDAGTIDFNDFTFGISYQTVKF